VRGPDLSYRAQLKGWKFIYLSDVVPPAELPVDMNGFKSQQQSLDEGFSPDVQEVVAERLRSQLPFALS